MPGGIRGVIAGRALAVHFDRWIVGRSHCYKWRMPFSAGKVVNAVAWAVVIGLVAVAIVLVNLWGPFGLVILGLLTLLICTQLDLHEHAPTWGIEVFKARASGDDSPEQRAARSEERRATTSPLRFYRLCGLLLVIAGAIAFAWQQWR
jgi:hypothetical protein